jgi:hypothetical protein
MEKALFLFIQELVLTPAVGIKHFDWYNGQPDDPKQHDTFKKPAAFLRVLPYTVNTYGNKRQAAKVVFEIILCQDQIKPFNNIQGDAAQLNSLKTFDLSSHVFKSIQGKSNNATGIGTISRRQGLPDHAYGAVICNGMSYSCRIWLDEAVAPTTSIPLDANLDIEEILVELPL